VIARPLLPFELAEPKMPSSTFGEHDLSTGDASELWAGAKYHASRGNYVRATVLMRWSVKNAGESGSLYDLACYTARSGDVDGALYWLQQAAQKSGVDASWAEQDADLESLRNDPRWSRMRAYLGQYNAFWVQSGVSAVSLVVPKGYDGRTPLPLLVGLHGLGDGPKHFVDANYQAFADEQKLAVLGVSGTKPQGPTSFSWSEDVERDTARVEAAIKEVSDRVQPAPGKIVLFGFSQGAAMAVEIAASHPERYAGAIAMSSGKTGEDFGWLEMKPRAANQAQGYIVVAGAGEHPGTVRMAHVYAEKLQSLGSRTYVHLYEGMNTHSFPPDFSENLAPWVSFVLDRQKKQPDPAPAVEHD
jgi:predicted esterase